jgi:hypothetical protein
MSNFIKIYLAFFIYIYFFSDRASSCNSGR